MKNQTLNALSDIEIQIYKIDELVNSLSISKVDTICNYVKWINECEAIFKKFNFVECSEFSSYKSLINIEIYSKKNKREVIKVAMTTIQPLQKVLLNKYSELHTKVENIRSLIIQIIIPLKQNGFINMEKNSDLMGYIDYIISELQKNEQISHQINLAISNIGKFDLARIIAEEL